MYTLLRCILSPPVPKVCGPQSAIDADDDDDDRVGDNNGGNEEHGGGDVGWQ